MVTFTVNIWGVIVSALAIMILGMVWYSPLLFGKKWMQLVGMTSEMTAEAKKAARTSYLISTIVSLLMSYVLGLFIKNMFTVTLGQSILVAFFAWLGFAATSMSNEYLYAVKQKPWSLYAINAGYQLGSLLIASIILFFFIF
jgi:hypothetical protein